MLMILSLLLLIAFAVLITALFRLKNLIAYCLSIYLLIFTNIALTGHIAHLFSLMNQRWFFLLFESLALIIAVFIWFRQGKPTLVPPFNPKEKKVSLLSCLRNLDLSLFAILIVAALGIQIALILAVSPNNNDSLAMHVPRTLYWLQHGNYSPWETNRIAQLFYPVNAQLQMLWTVLFSNSWNFLGFPQFFAQLAAALAVAGVARFLGVKPAGQIFSGLVFLAYPIVVAQSTTTQNDLIIGGLFGVSLYFLYSFFDEKKRVKLILSGIPIALALGTKLTAVFLLPGLAIILLLALVDQKIVFKELLVWAASLAVTFICCGLMIHIQNYQTYGNPLGAPSTVSNASKATASFQEAINQMVASSTKLTYQFIDPSGLPSPFWRWGLQLKSTAAEQFFDWIAYDIEDPIVTVNNHPFTLDRVYLLQEDEAVFGFVGFLAILPGALIAFIVGMKQRNIYLIAPFILYVTFIFSETLFRPGWTPYQGRYFIPIAIISTPLLGFLTVKKWIRWSVGPLSMIISAFILINSMAYNPAKPLLDYPITYLYRSEYDPQFREITSYERIWEKTAIEQVGAQTRSLIPICELIENHIPQKSTVGYYTMRNDYQFEICLFGEHEPRTVIPLYPYEELLHSDMVEDHEIDYVFLHEPPSELLDNFASLDLLTETDDGVISIYRVP